MMRLILALAAVTLLWLLATDSGAQPKGADHVAQPPAGWPREVKGYGQTEDDARRSALKAAVTRIRSFLRSQDPPVEAWQPDEAYVADHLLEGDGHLGNDVKLDMGLVKEWVQPLREPPNWSEIVRLNEKAQRTHLAGERRSLAGYVLAVLTALLAVGWGYVRLDESTGGRVSKWLGIGGVAVVGLAALVWWFGVS